jgi:hypothetical protein
MVSKSRCPTVVLHRQKQAVRELPDFEGLFRHRNMVAEREGFASLSSALGSPSPIAPALGSSAPSLTPQNPEIRIRRAATASPSLCGCSLRSVQPFSARSLLFPSQRGKNPNSCNQASPSYSGVLDSQSSPPTRRRRLLIALPVRGRPSGSQRRPTSCCQRFLP